MNFGRFGLADGPEETEVAEFTAEERSRNVWETRGEDAEAGRTPA